MTARRYPIGAECLDGGTIGLRVWAPDQRRVTAVVDGADWPMREDGDGYWVAEGPGGVGSRYGFRLGDDPEVLPDPASRWQPDGVFGRSAVFDAAAYRWRDGGWPGRGLEGQVIYELHVGTFTPEGTWRAAAAHLPRLAALGVTTVQMMPVNAFPGAFNWGYDGVFWCAPASAYGRPEDLQAFVDAAHAAGIGVLLDVVFNHLGPAGNVLPRYTRRYFSTRHTTEWGEALNFDGEGCHGVRTLVETTVAYYTREFHLDGFRLDAVHALVDDSSDHILAAIARTTRAAASPRAAVVIAEHEPQHATLIRPVEAGGLGLDGLFFEDLHHSWRVACTGIRDAYLSDYEGTSREWLSAALHGFLYQGQHYPWQSASRGQPDLDRPAWQHVAFLENHDQVANITGHRLRATTHPAWWRALSGLLLLGPWTPLVFQGQELGARTPFFYFCDHDAALQQAVAAGRREFLAQFTRSRDDPERPADEFVGRAAFARSVLHHPGDPESVPEWVLYRDALALRAEGPLGGPGLRGSTLSRAALLLRAPRRDGVERLLVVNLGADLALEARPDPLVAPPAGRRWHTTWCSEAHRYGGCGVARPRTDHGLVATGHATTLFTAEPM